MTYNVFSGTLNPTHFTSLQSNIGNTLRPVSTVFRHSGVTPPKVNQFGWNLEHWVHCLRLALADFGHDIRAIMRAPEWRTRRNFCHVNHDITDFSWPKITKFEHNTSIAVAMNFFPSRILKMFPQGVAFPKKRKSRIQAVNSAVIIDRRKFITKWSLCGMYSFHFTVEINLNSFPWPVHSVQETSPQFFLQSQDELLEFMQTWGFAISFATC